MHSSRRASRRHHGAGNRWGLTTDPNSVVRIYKAVDLPWLGVNMDTGNYVGDPYEGMEVLAPHCTIVQAKTCHGGGVWYTLCFIASRQRKSP